MTLTPEQKAAVSGWIAAGENLSAVQKKLREQFSVSMTYMEVRFLVDDLNLNLKDPAPKADATDVTKPMPAPGTRTPGPAPARSQTAGPAAAGADEDLVPADDSAAPGDDADDDAFDESEDALPAGGAGNVTVDVDKVTLNPGAIASGSVTFSDGVTAKWIVDNYGRPGFTEVSKPGYRPKSDDAQAFMQELSLQLQKRGF